MWGMQFFWSNPLPWRSKYQSNSGMDLLGVGGDVCVCTPPPLALARGSAGGGAIFHDKAKNY